MSSQEQVPARSVVLVDRFGYGRYHHRDGRPFLPANDYAVRLVTSLDNIGESVGAELEAVVGVSPYDEEAIIEAARYLRSAGGRPADQFVTITEMLLVPLARLREELGMAGQTVHQALLFRDKVMMKEHLRKHGITVPEFAPFSNEAANQFLEHRARFFVKPRQSAGSVGAFTISDRADLDRFTDTYRGRLDKFQIEEFIDGRQFHIDSIVERGRVLVALAGENVDPTLVYRTMEPFREVSVSTGPLLDELLAFNERVVACYPDHTGIIHHEVFMQNGEIIHCELACRTGGGGIAAGFRHRTGVDLFETLLHAQATGQVPPPPTVAARGTGFAVIYGGPGTLREPLIPPDEPWIIDAEIYAQPGDKIEIPRHWGEMLAIISVEGESDALAFSRVNEVIERMKPCVG